MWAHLVAVGTTSAALRKLGCHGSAVHRGCACCREHLFERSRHAGSVGRGVASVQKNLSSHYPFFGGCGMPRVMWYFGRMGYQVGGGERGGRTVFEGVKIIENSSGRAKGVGGIIAGSD